MPWTAKWIAAIVGTFVLLVIADRIWFVQEMKTLADKLGVGWSKIERRGTFPYEYYKKVVHYGMTKDEVHSWGGFSRWTTRRPSRRRTSRSNA
ncbi:MAG: hypothetical protein AUH95_04430 [Nitrospirae bacterium 13_2_20CM_2_63_8]|nr:MAG: hypothetical protein AUH95_04430 [Nitrospirae bacterium 13_2_20CM_2_63_8]